MKYIVFQKVSLLIISSLQLVSAGRGQLNLTKILTLEYSSVGTGRNQCQNNISIPSAISGYSHRVCSKFPFRKCSGKFPSECTESCARRGESCLLGTGLRCCPLASTNFRQDGLLVNYCRNYLQSRICRVCASHGGRCGTGGFPCCEGFACREKICVHRFSCNLKTSRRELTIRNRVYVSKYCTDPEYDSPPKGYTFECPTLRSKTCTKCALPGTSCQNDSECCQNTQMRIESISKLHKTMCNDGTCDICGTKFKNCLVSKFRSGGLNNLIN